MLDRYGSELLWGSFSKHSSDIIAVVDRGGIIQFQNRSVNSELKDVIGTSLFKHLDDDSAERTRDYLEKSFETKKPQRYEIRIVRQDGSVVWYRNNLTPVIDDGKAVLVIYVSQNITQEQQLSEALTQNEKLFSFFFDDTSDYFMILDPDLNFIRVNKPYAIRHSKNPEYFVGKNLLEVFPDLDKSGRVEKYREVLRTKIPISFDNIMTRSFDGSHILNIRAFALGDNLGMIVSDLAPRRLFENRIRIIQEYAYSISSASSADEIIDLTFQTIKDTFGLEVSSFHVTENEMVTPIRCVGANLDEFVPVRIDGKSVVARTVRERKTQNIPDTRIDPDYLSSTGSNTFDMLSELAVPLVIDDTVFGVINLESPHLNAFSTEDQGLVEILAQFVSSSLSRIFRLRDSEVFQRRLRVLYEHSMALDQAVSEMDVMEITYAALNKALDGNVYDIMIFEDGALTDLFFTDERPFSIKLDGLGITVRAAREKKSQLVNDVRTDPDYVQGTLPRPVLSELAVPILVDGETYALINVESFKLNAFVEQDKDILETFAVNIANAIERLKRLDILESTVQERTQELKESNKRLLELDKMKNQFISIAAHELRTPLTSIIGYNELIEDRAEDLPQEVLLYLDIIKRNTDRLVVLTNDLLVSQRLITGKIKLNQSESNLKILVLGIIQEIEPLSATKLQTIRLETSGIIPDIALDRVRISQVISNILNNASKFSPEKSEILVKISAEPDSVVVSVTDAGIGIAEEYLGKLFKPFPDIPGRDSYPGTGLGLSVCHGFIELHGGKIWAESKGAGKGTTISFSLPIKQS